MDWHDLVNSRVKWFPSLVSHQPGDRSLLSEYPERQASAGLLVCGIMRDDRLQFALFPNYMKFASFHLSLPEKHRCFFEIILGDYPQKPHFDLDINLETTPDFEDNWLDQYVEAIVETFRSLYGFELNLATDLLVFYSHGPNKRSYHLVIDNYCHPNHREAKLFCQEVVNRLPSHLSGHLDQTVYAKKQQFRIVGSQKKSSGRVKMLLSTWSYYADEITYQFKEPPLNSYHGFNLILEASLVSQTSSCRMLPFLIKEDPKVTVYPTSGDLTKPQIRTAVNLLANYLKIPLDDPAFPFQVRQVLDNLILLKRLRPSYCQVCQRVHDSENPYLVVITNQTGQGHVYFDCRRSDRQRKLHLGSLQLESPTEPKKETANLAITSFEQILTKINQTGQISMKECRQKRRHLENS